MDDETGWHEVLLRAWTPGVRDAVVARIEAATVGRRGWFVRVLAGEADERPGWTETVHALIVAAIRDETGADLDELGSQAAWEAYEQVWDRLVARWGDGGGLAVVPLGAEPEVVEALVGLPGEAAAALGADVTGPRPQPLWLAGRLRVDLEGLAAYRRLDGGLLPREVAARLAAIEAGCRGRGSP